MNALSRGRQQYNFRTFAHTFKMLHWNIMVKTHNKDLCFKNFLIHIYPVKHQSTYSSKQQDTQRCFVSFPCHSPFSPFWQSLSFLEVTKNSTGLSLDRHYSLSRFKYVKLINFRHLPLAISSFQSTQVSTSLTLFNPLDNVDHQYCQSGVSVHCPHPLCLRLGN